MIGVFINLTRKEKMVVKTKICKDCNCSFVPMKDENYCPDCRYNRHSKVLHPETERHKKVIRRGRG